jgi:hypothetical protein
MIIERGRRRKREKTFMSLKRSQTCFNLNRSTKEIEKREKEEMATMCSGRTRKEAEINPRPSNTCPGTTRLRQFPI